ncbi:hypothetical protein Lgee_0253 [Legionella geestiana]|uniref:UPF0250 protein Lgee_0253 n=1 Tax=Legionella geestiana TaxID=45065 RepID=A0A0W0U8X7_9GAMM|nr:DUF493 domain-containing protein [Legionella geestiana]KTD04223.1 hypothetical protein Lgee_0253 [Legionella geestiana]QBS11644.1 DUF493 domain-containing protein [Legionella geestiana]QDQ40745.1 DUF493 domain-containing protein [Legionella geestiana]STX53672.1 putative lipoate regulatory protein YbeD [Legionella geestiana]
MTDKETLLSFPCDFPIKIMGKATDAFLMDITRIVKHHFPAVDEASFRLQPSREKNYLSVTVTVPATSQEGLDALYEELTQYPDVRMVL